MTDSDQIDWGTSPLKSSIRSREMYYTSEMQEKPRQYKYGAIEKS